MECIECIASIQEKRTSQTMCIWSYILNPRAKSDHNWINKSLFSINLQGTDKKVAGLSMVVGDSFNGIIGQRKSTLISGMQSAFLPRDVFLKSFTSMQSEITIEGITSNAIDHNRGHHKQRYDSPSTRSGPPKSSHSMMPRRNHSTVATKEESIT